MQMRWIWAQFETGRFLFSVWEVSGEFYDLVFVFQSERWPDLLLFYVSVIDRQCFEISIDPHLQGLPFSSFTKRHVPDGNSSFSPSELHLLLPTIIWTGLRGHLNMTARVQLVVRERVTAGFVSYGVKQTWCVCVCVFQSSVKCAVKNLLSDSSALMV